jgi:hypothetical protein
MLFGRLAGLESRTQAPLEMVVVHWLGKVTNDAVLQGAIPGDLIGVCGDEDRRDRVPGFDEVFMELNARHSRHLNVGDQARGRGEEGRCQEIVCRGKRFDSVAKQCHELSHGFAKELIILDNRYQCTFRHHSFPVTFCACNWVMSEKTRNQAMPAPLNNGLGFRLFA